MLTRVTVSAPAPAPAPMSAPAPAAAVAQGSAPPGGACRRCVRALARDRAAVCVPPVAGNRRRKCGRCSRGGHPCENDPLPPALAAAVFAAASGGQDVRPALRRWEAALPRTAPARPAGVSARPLGLFRFVLLVVLVVCVVLGAVFFVLRHNPITGELNIAGQNQLKRNFGDITTVLLIVGEAKEEFHLHEFSLFEASTFFKRAFTSKYKDSKERVMELPDDDATVFEGFARWLDFESDHVRLKEYKPLDKANGAVMQAVRLYLLADKYDVRKLRNDICRSLFPIPVQAEFEAPPRCAVRLVYRKTPQKSAIRRLFVDWYTYQCDTVWFESTQNQSWLLTIPELAVDLAVAFAHGGECDPKDSPFMSKKSDYYDESSVTTAAHLPAVIQID